jgi:hypothetical protein
MKALRFILRQIVTRAMSRKARDVHVRVTRTSTGAVAVSPCFERGNHRSPTDNGRRQIVIRHQELSGVTPRMLDWWYGHVGGEMEYAGKIYSRYLVWHPLTTFRTS